MADETTQRWQVCGTNAEEREAMLAGDDVAGREPNRLLSAARQARRLTQQQLAEAVGAVHWRLFGREAAIDADHVSKLERGLIRWPNKRYREAFRAVLGAATDAELGLYSRPRATVEATRVADRAAEVDRVRRNEFMWLVTGLGASAGLDVAGVSDPVREVLSLAGTPISVHRVGRTEVEQVHYAAETFRSWRGRYGGGACRDALVAQLRWAAGLLRGRVEGPTCRELHSAVGSLAQVAGWGSVDAGDHETALTCFRLALYCAGESCDWTLRAQVLTDMSRQAVDCGQLDDATSLIELAQVRGDRVAGTGRAMMSSMHARVLGAAGRVADCRTAMMIAEDHFAGHQPIGERSGSSLFQQATAADIALYNGHALFDASLRHSAAAPAALSHLRTVLDHSGAISRRRRAMSTVKLATLELVHGDRDEGIALAGRALDLGEGVRSARLIGDLRRLRTATTGHTGVPVDALRQQLDSVLVSG